MCYRLWVWSLGFSRVYSTSTFDLASRILSAQVHLQLVLYYTYLLVNLLLNILCVLWKYVFSYECCNQTYSYTSKENVSLHFSFINESFRVIAIDFCNNNVVRVNRFANALSVLSSSVLFPFALLPSSALSLSLSLSVSPNLISTRSFRYQLHNLKSQWFTFSWITLEQIALHNFDRIQANSYSTQSIFTMHLGFVKF